MYYKGAKGALIVFDLSSKTTFVNAEKWYNEIKKATDPSINLILVGNKSDLKDKRQVNTEDAENKAKEMGIAYMETSALNAENVDKAFSWLIEEISKKLKKEDKEALEEENNTAKDVKESQTINLNTTKKENEGLKKNCCQNINLLALIKK